MALVQSSAFCFSPISSNSRPSASSLSNRFSVSTVSQRCSTFRASGFTSPPLSSPQFSPPPCKEQFKLEEPISRSPESLATRDFSASGLSSRTGTADWDSKFEDAQVDEAESTLKEALCLNYEEARALLGRLEYQRGNFDAALQAFYGIDIRNLSPRMIKAINDRTRQRSPKSKGENVGVGAMSLHSVSLLLEAILLKAKSLQEMGRINEAAKECKMILDIVESALPNGIPVDIAKDCKLQEMFHKALELLPKLWIQAGFLNEAIIAYRRALVKPWNLDPQMLSSLQKDLAATLLYGGVEATLPPPSKLWEPNIPRSSTEEALLLLFILMKKVSFGEIKWDPEIISHLTFALSMCGQFECLADHVEQLLPGTYTRVERWYFLALCYSAAGQNESALNILKKISGSSEAKHEPHLQSFLLGAKLCSQDHNRAHEGINFARKVIEFGDHENAHFKSTGHKFLGVCYGNAARISLSDSARVFFQGESLKSLNEAALIGNGDDPEVLFNLGLENAIQRNLNAAFGKAFSNVKGSAETDESSLVVCFGEMLIDFVPTINGLALAEAPAFKKAPGGAPANVAVGIARLGGSSAFIGKVGEDEFGYMLADILKENNVNSEGMRFDPGARTALAFVTLKKDGEREFMFYRNPSADMLLQESELDLDLIRKAKIFHYGSISLITEPCKSAHIAATKVAKDAGVILSYDPNLRLPLWPSAESAREGILSIWDTADIIKISEEEIAFLTKGEDPYDDNVVRKLYHPNLKLLLVTEGPDGCRYYTKEFSGKVKGLKVEPVDTTGAGDAFVAGILSQIAADISLLQDEGRLREALSFANACGAITVTERGAIPALPTREAVNDALLKIVA